MISLRHRLVHGYFIIDYDIALTVADCAKGFPASLFSTISGSSRSVPKNGTFISVAISLPHP